MLCLPACSVSSSCGPFDHYRKKRYSPLQPRKLNSDPQARDSLTKSLGQGQKESSSSLSQPRLSLATLDLGRWVEATGIDCKKPDHIPDHSLQPAHP